MTLGAHDNSRHDEPGPLAVMAIAVLATVAVVAGLNLAISVWPVIPRWIIPVAVVALALRMSLMFVRSVIVLMSGGRR